jgi:hypothetical protein
MKQLGTAFVVALALSALPGCAVATANPAWNDLPIETPKASYSGPKVSGKRAAIVEVADERAEKVTYWVGDDKYTTPSNLRVVMLESLAATLREAGFQTVNKDSPADLKLKVTLTAAVAEGGATKPGVGVVAMRVTAQTAGGTFERTIVGRDYANPFMGDAGGKAQSALRDTIAMASFEAAKACVDLVKLEGGGT